MRPLIEGRLENALGCRPHRRAIVFKRSKECVSAAQTRSSFTKRRLTTTRLLAGSSTLFETLCAGPRNGAPANESDPFHRRRGRENALNAMGKFGDAVCLQEPNVKREWQGA